MAPISSSGASAKRGSTVHSTWPNSVHENFYERPATNVTELGAWCYTDRLSYLPGERIFIHTCTTSARYELVIYRDGAARTEVLVEYELPGEFYETPPDCSVNGCKWPIAKHVEVPPSWKSGGYILLIRAKGADGSIVEHHFPFAIRAPKPSQPDAILLLNCTSTWVAYNDWGGSNFYEGILGDKADQATPVASTLRPFSRGFAWLPVGAPRIPLREPPNMGAALRYPHMDWAYANGFSKKYASAGWATYERHFLRWAESNGYTVDVATQHDLHRDPGILTGYRCAAIVGHDEYWSWPMRDAIDAYVSRGGRVARFAGNFTWQIRLEDQETRQICYKHHAEAKDPVRDTPQQHLLTTSWDDVAVSRPGTLTFGLTASRGIYAGWGGCVPRGSGGFTVYRPEHWAFEGTDLYYGDQLGANAKVFGYEVDGCDYTIRGGLPYADGTDGAPADMEIIALGLATTVEANHGNLGSTFFIGSADAREVAHQRLRRADPQALDQVTRGAGMIVSFNRGSGSVFNAASCEWVSGLIERDPFVERLTHNVLTRFTAEANHFDASDAYPDIEGAQTTRSKSDPLADDATPQAISQSPDSSAVAETDKAKQPPAEPQYMPVRKVFAVGLGNALAFYDFLTYGFFAIQIGHCFFPTAQTTHGLLFSLATFSVGFITRPLGSIVIGTFGDRAGRKPAMILSFTLMGIGIIGLALTPSYATIGIAAPILLLMFRLLQGFAMGGEVGPSTAFLIEVAPPNRRGLYVAVQYMTQDLAVLAAGLVGFALSNALSPASLDQWGWRLAFLVGAGIVPFGLYLRRSLPETLTDADRLPAALKPRRTTRRLVILGLLLISADSIGGYALSYMTTYAQDTLRLAARIAFGATVMNGIGNVIGDLLSGLLSDRVGRKPVMVASVVLLLLLVLPAYLAMIRFPGALTLYVGTTVLCVLEQLFGTAALVMLTEALPKAVRSSVLATVYALATTAFGGTTQIVIKLLTETTGSALAPAWYMTGALALGAAAVFLIRETAPVKTGLTDLPRGHKPDGLGGARDI